MKADILNVRLSVVWRQFVAEGCFQVKAVGVGQLDLGLEILLDFRA